ncbi:MAG: LysR family transcriptional regulator [Ramlibacter sp.]|nr:LysR family transcriptional regulator [Ramlibacter sp.]
MPRPLKFRQIEAFRAVMQTGTTTAAAALLNTTQPSISRLLAQMGAATALKLFEAERGRLKPTREAKDLFDVIERNFLGLDLIEQRVATLRRTGAGMLRVGCTPALALSLMPPVVAAFCRKHPEVHVSLQTHGGHQLWEGLQHGAFDVVLSTMPAAHLQAKVATLHRARTVCVLHAGHPLAARTRLHVRDLHGQVLLTLPPDDTFQRQFQQQLLAHGVEPAATVETTYSFTICRMAAEGAGIGIVNPYVASVFARDVRVVPLTPSLAVEIVRGYPPQFAPSRTTEAFVDLFEAQLKALPKE